MVPTTLVTDAPGWYCWREREEEGGGERRRCQAGGVKEAASKHPAYC